jgi:hypothetical protein
MKIILYNQEMYINDELELEVKELAEKFANHEGNLLFLDAGELFCFWVSADEFLQELTELILKKTKIQLTEEEFSEFLADEENNELGFETLYDFACKEDSEGVSELFDKTREELKEQGKKTDSKRRIYNTLKKRWTHRLSARAKFDDALPN